MIKPDKRIQAAEDAKTLIGELHVFFDGKEHPLRESIEIITDEMIDHGQCSHQTILDMRDAIKCLLTVIDEDVIDCSEY